MFKVSELIEATGAKLIRGRKERSVRGISIDTRSLKPGEAFIAIKGNNFDGHDFIDQAIKKGASVVIFRSPGHQVSAERSGASPKVTRSPGNITYLQVKDTTKALGDIAHFHRKKFAIPIIAVTGSNGKTTTKDMIAWVLGDKFKVLKNEGTKNNHIGLPMALLSLDSTYDFAVLEAGANHPGEIGYLAKVCSPNIGVITNVGPAHLEHFKNLKGVFQEKSKLFKYLQEPHIAIVNSDDSFLRKELVRRNSFQVFFGFGIKNHSDFYVSDIKRSLRGLEFEVNKKYKFTLRTFGYYNIYNALAAIAVGRILGIGYKDIAARLKVFNFPQGRLKIIRFKQATFIDDTYNANPASLGQALDVLADFPVKGRKILVMGDMLELGPSSRQFHAQAGKMVALVCDCLIAVGKFSKVAADRAKESGFNIENIFTCADSIQAREILFKKILPSRNDIVLVKGSRAMKMEEVFKF